MSGFEITALAVVGFATVVIWSGAKMVPQGHNWTVERFGKYTRTLTPGLNIIVPFIDGIGHRQNM
ncbi:MAG: SPFH/Band 7/PHB domain protein, partial [Pseudomonadales bacterium]|nr:SPFH/Band 7/PHB domain protein [Pseudomonadales bacterium]